MDSRDPRAAVVPARLDRTTVRCTRCAATLDVSLGVRSASCVYCTAPTATVNPTTSPERATHLVPFAVDHASAMEKIERSLRIHGAPEGLRGPDPERLRAVYVPAALGTARAHVDYAAEVVPSDLEPSDGPFLPHVSVAGRWSGDLGANLATLSRGLTTIEIGELHVDIGTLVPIHPRQLDGQLDGLLVEHASPLRQQCREEILAESAYRCGAFIDRLLPGSLHRNLRHAPVSLQWDLAIILLPIWVLAMPCGQDGSDVRRVLVNGASGRVILPKHVQAAAQTRTSRWNPAAVAAFAACSSDAVSGHPATAGSMPCCARCGTSVEAAEPMCPVCRLIAPSHDVPELPCLGTALTCERCGASVMQTEPLQPPRCRFCAASVRPELVRNPLDLPELFVPYLVDEASARAAVDAWIGGQSWFRRRALRRANLDLLRPLWWPAWIVSGRVLVSWTTIGRQPGSLQGLALAGQLGIEINGGIVPASRVLDAKNALALTDGLPLPEPSTASVGVSGAAIELFETDRAQPCQWLAACGVARARRQMPRPSWGQPKIATMVSDMKSRRVGFPAWSLVDASSDRPLHILVSGQDSSRIVARGG